MDAFIAPPSGVRVAHRGLPIALWVLRLALVVVVGVKHGVRCADSVGGRGVRSRPPCRDLYVHFGRNSEDKLDVKRVVKCALVMLWKKTCHLCCSQEKA